MLNNSFNNRKGGYKQLPKKNEQIRAQEIELIDETGKHHASYKLTDAINRALELDLSVVEIRFDRFKPVCKIVDYSKFQHQKRIQESLNRAKRKFDKEKEIQISATTSKGDLDRSVKQAEEMLLEGYKLRIVLSFKGRTVTQKAEYMGNMDYFLAQLEPVSKIFQKPTTDGKKSIARLVPIAKQDIKLENKNSAQPKQNTENIV